MTFRQFVLNNVFRNKRLYAAYFLSSLFTVSVFFTFAMFAFHPTLTGPDMNSNVLKGLSVAGGIIYVFSFFFVLYSMNAFLRSRNKEFGVLLMHGMSNGQIRWMVFLENMLVGFFATVIGILIGLIFSKAILLIAENVLVIEGQLNFYFPLMAIMITFVSFIILFFFISLFIAFILRTKRLITFIKGEKIEKREPKFSITLSLLAIILLGSGYGIALTVRGLSVVTALIPVALLVTVGTYLLFSQLSIFIIQKFKNNKGLFWRKTNMLLFADLSYRMKDNARSFFIVAIISTVAFSAIGTLFGLNSFLTKGIVESNPTDYSYIPFEDEEDEKIEANLQFIEETMDEHGLTVRGESVSLHYFDQGEGDTDVLIAPVSDYNKYANLIGEKEISVEDKFALPVDSSNRTIVDPKSEKYDLTEIVLSDGFQLPVDWERLGEAKPDVLPKMLTYYIVSDENFAKLAEPTRTTLAYDWQVVRGSEEKIIEVGQGLTNEMEGSFISIDYIVYSINQINAPIMFVGLFIGIIFFVSAGSFLYFRLYSDLDEDEAKFAAISKMGLTNKEMKSVVSRQTAILFFTPIIVAIIHGAVALTALSNLFKYDLLMESFVVLASFFLIQIVYFLVVRYFYIRQIIRAIS